MTILARDEITLSKIVKKVDITDAVNGVQVGGRNLLVYKKISFPTGVSDYGHKDLEANASTGLITGTGQYYLSFDVGFEPNTDYVIKAETISLGGTEGGSCDLVIYNIENGSIAQAIGGLKSGQVIRFKTNANITDAMPLFAYVSYGATTAYAINRIKLEKGNKATDWTPAPEDQESYTDVAAGAVQNSVDDMGERVTASETVIQQLADSLSNIVRGSDGSSLVRQDENGLFYFDVEPLQNSADESARKLAEILDVLGDIDSSDEETLLGKLDKLEEELLALGIKTEYIGKSTYTADDGNEEPCLVLGETDSTFKLLITNTRIVFLEGSTETTYIKDNTLVTNNVEVKNEIRQGSWAWKARPNGNLGLVWIGGDN